MTFPLTGRKLKILDFDLECRPLSWYGGDWVTKEITAIGWAWVGPKRPLVRVSLLSGASAVHRECLVADFLEAYNKADMVTGHFIRGFDLPLLNAHLIELDWGTLPPKLTQDTKLDLVKFSGLSKSQENLGALMGLDHPKVSMNQQTWREANRLTLLGRKLVERRVKGDVRQHVELRRRLLDLGVLGPPKMWAPQSSGKGGYSV